jgi:hypothetical protein
MLNVSRLLSMDSRFRGNDGVETNTSQSNRKK